MNKKFLIAWLVMFIAYMATGFIVHGVLLHEDYLGLPNLFRSEEESLPYFYLMIIAHIVMAGAFVCIYSRGVENKPWLGQGLRFGLCRGDLTRRGGGHVRAGVGSLGRTQRARGRPRRMGRPRTQ